MKNPSLLLFINSIDTTTYCIIPLSTRVDGGAVVTGTFPENPLLEGYLLDNDLVQYLSDDTIEVLQKRLDKIISW